MNDGFITNLPYDACVEVPMYVDKNGLHPFFIGELPAQLAAMNQSNISVQSLAADAAIDGDPEMVEAAIALDPLTSAVCTLKEVRDMVIEMLEAEKKWLPQFEGKTLKPLPIISIPKDVKPKEVPMDPALAIVHRFGKLAND
jgi:alpha-galactosidase